MQVSPTVRQSIDSEGRRRIQRKDGEVSYGFRPEHLTTFDIFDDRDIFDEWFKEHLNKTFNNNFDSSESFTRGPEQPKFDAPGQVCDENSLNQHH
jgi:hypothetical protein